MKFKLIMILKLILILIFITLNVLGAVGECYDKPHEYYRYLLDTQGFDVMLSEFEGDCKNNEIQVQDEVPQPQPFILDMPLMCVYDY